MDINSLPMEVLAEIFTYLDVKTKGQAAQVCSLWKEASYHRPAWRDVKARINFNDSAELLCGNLARRDIRHVRALSVEINSIHKIRALPHLEELDVSFCENLTDADLMMTFRKTCDSLKVLNLSMCNGITFAGLRIALHACANLQSLNLSSCINITDDVILVIASELPKLLSLNISHSAVTDMGLRNFLDFTGKSNGNTIECLILRDCRSISNEGLKHISRGLLKLKTLDIAYCNLTNLGMKYVARMESLKELKLQHSQWLSIEGLSFFYYKKSSLISLDISFCNKLCDLDMLVLAKGMPVLRHLSLNGCKIGDNGILFLSRYLLVIHSLSICNCRRITDRGLNYIYTRMLRLKFVNISGCRKVSPAGIALLKQNPRLAVKSVMTLKMF